MITLKFSDKYDDIAQIHDALYSYNLSKTKTERVAVSAERFREQGAFLAVDENGTSHGGIAFHWNNEPKHIFVDYFFLDESIRGTGLGRKLFDMFLPWAKENGAVRIDLETSTFQAPGFYQKMGFRITGEEKKPFPGCPENVYYSLSLNL